MIWLQRLMALAILPLCIASLVLTFTGQRTPGKFKLIAAIDFTIALGSAFSGYYLMTILWAVGGYFALENSRRC